MSIGILWSRCVLRRRLSGRMQGFEKRDQGCGFRWIQAVAIRRHIAAALQDLADQLILGEPRRDRIQRRSTLAALFTERVAVAALLALKHESSLTFESGSAIEELFRNRLRAPRVHFRTPRAVSGQMREGS